MNFQNAIFPAKPLVKPIYFPAFDYLRFVLALAVVAFHADAFTWPHAGNFPVQIFFALSGWLIGGILLNTKATDLPRFFYNRAARIWVPYFVTVALLIGAYLIFTRHVTGKWLEFTFYKLTFVYDFFAIHRDTTDVQWNGNHLWSICAEEQFYLIAPLLIVLVPKIGRSVWFWLGLSAAVLMTPATEFFGAICLGVVAAIVQKDHFPDWHHKPAAILALSIGSAGLFVAVYVSAVPYFTGSAFTALMIVLALAQPGGKPSGLAAFLGGMSYSLYLHHWIGLWLATVMVRRFGIGQHAYEAAALLLSFTVAAMLYVLIDSAVRAHRADYFTVQRGRTLAVMGFSLVGTGCLVGLYLA